MTTFNIKNICTNVINLLLEARVRAVIYIVAFLFLWGWQMSKFIFNDPIDVLTNFGRLTFVPELSHNDIILMIGRGTIMYAIFFMLGFSCIEGILNFVTYKKTFFKVFTIIWILLVVWELYWERNYHSLILTFTNFFG